MHLALIAGRIGIALGVGAASLALVKECSEPIRTFGASTSRKEVGSRRRSPSSPLRHIWFRLTNVGVRAHVHYHISTRQNMVATSE